MKEGILGILKFFLFLLVLPAVGAAALSFQNSVLGMPVTQEQWFLWGVALFVLVYLFLYNFKEVYDFGHLGIANLLKALGPTSHAIAFVFPVYTIVIAIVYFLLNLVTSALQYEGPLTVLLGFSVAMHIILTAHQLYEADKSRLKGQYLLYFGVALIANLIVMAFLVSMVIPEISPMTFLDSLWNKAAYYYQTIYQMLFVPS